MTLPGAIQRHPRLRSWLRFHSDRTVTVCTGKAEIGQGIKTAIAMIAAEELDVALARIVVQTADTERAPNEFVTAGSMSIEDSGSAVRTAAATARGLLFDAAGKALGLDQHDLVIDDGTISSTHSNRQLDYWSLDEDVLDVAITSVAAFKSAADYSIVGHRANRIDLPAKLTGKAAFVHDLSPPGLLHGRLVKPPFYTARLETYPRDFAAPGLVKLVHTGSFIGVIAEREDQAVTAAENLGSRCRWTPGPPLPDVSDIHDDLRRNVTRSLPVIDGTPVDALVPEQRAPDAAVATLTASYSRPYQMHGSLGPSAALAHYHEGKDGGKDDGTLTVYSHSQGVEMLRAALSGVLDMEMSNIHVVHVEGAGCYGHNGADDVALDAALLARAVSPRPVLAKWTRSDEHGYEPYAPAMAVDMAASLDARGRIVAWRHDVYSTSHSGRPAPVDGYSNLQTAAWLDPPHPPIPKRPGFGNHSGIHRNADPIYRLPAKQIVKHFVADGPLRTSSMRGLGAYANVLAIESFMDELRLAAQQDPFEFRLAHLDDARGRRVLERLRVLVPEASGQKGTGRGLGFARYKNRQAYCGIAVELTVQDDGTIRLMRAWIVADAGLAIDPDGLKNQLEGGFIQAASWTLKEAVGFDRHTITTRDWHSYPILKFSEVPEITTELIEPADARPLGAGEASAGPTGAAIANAVFAASGIRVRDVPFTPERLRQSAAN